MKKVLLTAMVVAVISIGNTYAQDSDIVINGNVGQVCSAKQGGECNQTLYLTENHYHTHQNNIRIHGDVDQVCSAKTGGNCNMGGRNYSFNAGCIRYMDGKVWCY